MVWSEWRWLVYSRCDYFSSRFFFPRLGRMMWQYGAAGHYEDSGRFFIGPFAAYQGVRFESHDGWLTVPPVPVWDFPCGRR